MEMWALSSMSQWWERQHTSMTLTQSCVISFPGYSMTLRKWEKCALKHLKPVNEHSEWYTHTHSHSKRLPNAVQKQCPIVQLPCFVPPPNFTSSPRPLSLPQSAPSNYTGTRTQTHACAQFTLQAHAKISLICKISLKHGLALLLSHCCAKHVTNGCALVPKQWQWLRGTPTLRRGLFRDLQPSPMGLHLVFSHSVSFLWLKCTLTPEHSSTMGSPQGPKISP